MDEPLTGDQSAVADEVCLLAKTAPLWLRATAVHRGSLPRSVSAAIRATLVALGVGHAATGSPSLDVVAAWGGPVNAVQIDGSTAYLSSGRRLVILDVSDINNFVELGSLTLGNTIADLAVREGLAFAITRAQPNCFNVIDVSVPASPKVTWSSTSELAWSISSPRKVVLWEDRAYIREGSGFGAIMAVDIADPGVPIAPVSAIQYGVIEVSDFAIVDDLMYVASATPVRSPADISEVPALFVHDLVADPDNPPQIASLDIPLDKHAGMLRHLASSGSYVYGLASYDPPGEVLLPFTNLVVIDIAVPRSPKLISSIELGEIVLHGIAIANGRLFIAAGDSLNSPTPEDWAEQPGLLIYDIASNPSNPAFIRNYKTHGSIFDVHALSNMAWLSDAGEGLIALDVTTPTSPIRKDNYHSPAMLTGIEKVNNRLYVSDAWNGFTILDASDATAPKILGVYQTPLTPPVFGKGEFANHGIRNADIAVRDNLAYLAAGFAGIQVINVGNPTNPSKFGGTAPYLPGQHATSIELDGNVAHVGVGMGFTGLYKNYSIADIFPPIVLPELAALSIISGPGTIATRDGYSYLACSGWLQIVDTTDSEAPTLANAGTGDPAAYDLRIADDLLYVADGDGNRTGGLKIYSLSRPVDPSLVDGGYWPGQSSVLAIGNERAYVTHFSTGGTDCMAIDVANPNQPQLLALQPEISNGENNALLADEPYIYAATAHGFQFDDKGLMILKLDGLVPDNPVDLNQDGIVNGFDLALLLGQWTGSAFYSPCPPHIPADLTHDCRVNGGDLFVLLGNWG